jgi:PAS domain S-box-containing protein
VLCVPVEHHDELVGVLYLENSKLDNVFGDRAHSVVRILASQAAISIANARLIDGLRRSEARFELAMDASYDGLWDWDVASDRVYLSPGWRRLVGYEHEGLYTDTEAWRDVIRPADRERVRAELEQLVNRAKDRSELEIQLQHTSGRWLDILSRAQAVRNEHGETVRVVGTHQDITARKRAEQQIKKDLAERELLLRELYHRTKNNMQVIVSLLRMREHDTKESSIHELVEDIADKIQSMALVHQMLYESNDLNQIDLGEYVEEFSATVFGSGAAYDRRIRLEYDVSHCPVAIDVAVPLGMVLSELMSNSVKHAFPETEGNDQKVIYISVSRVDTRIRVLLRDNGRGIDPHRDLRDEGSMGLQTVFALVEHQLGGAITYAVDDGLVWTIEVDARGV